MSRTGGFEMNVVVDSSIEEVFAVVSDLKNDPKWRREWVDASTSDGPYGVGSTSRVVGQFLRWRIEAEYEVTRYEPNQIAAWKTVRGPLPLKFWRRVDDAHGGTRVTIGYTLESHGLAKVLDPLAKAMGKRALAGDLPTLKEMIQARSA